MRARGPSSATLSEVAALAGVSLATASRVLNNSERTVGEPHRSKVRRAAERLGYSPNAHAQAVARGASDLLGLVVQDIDDPYYSTIVDGVTRVADAHGLVVLLSTAHHDPVRELELLATVRAQRVRAMVLVGSRRTDRRHEESVRRELQSFRETGGRLASVGQDRLGIPTVVPRNRAGALELAEALAGLGHARFVVLGGPRDLLTARDRVAGFKQGVRQAGLPPEAATVLSSEFTRDGGYAAATRMIEEGLEATCVFAVNDVMAVGAMAAFRHAGYRIPDDVSIAGFDDIATLRDVAPSLTTVQLPLREMGEWAAGLALGPPDSEPDIRHVPGVVVMRGSTAAVAPMVHAV